MRRRTHALAFLGTAAARFRAALAMIHVVFLALGRARGTNSCAQAAECRGKAAIAAHQRRRQSAHVGAVSIQPNALGHSFDVLFFETRGRAVFAFCSAFFASVDTTLVIPMGHRRPFPVAQSRQLPPT